MIRFDDAVDTALQVLLPELPHHSHKYVVTLVRDPSGQLTVVLPDDVLPTAGWSPLAHKLNQELGAYSPGIDSVLLAHRDLISAPDILDSPDGVRLPLDLPSGPEVFLVDRLLTNLDWTRKPLANTAPIPVASFYSIKGGVGRTTALIALARFLARAAKRVLIVDLDLEAPGLGPALLGANEPDYGMIDWLVESLVGQADSSLFEQVHIRSQLDHGTPGTILVCPAAGSKTKDYVSKVGRAYLPTRSPDGAEMGLANRLLLFLKCASERLEPVDVVLFDARAGLSDAGSAAVTQLGAEVFLFGRDDPQSWNSYQNLFEHLRLSRGIEFSMPDHDLRNRLKMVAAQVEPNEAAMASWIDRSYSTWERFYDSEEVDLSPGAPAATTFNLFDEMAPHFPLRVLFDQQLRGANWLDPGMRPDDQSLDAVFGEFVRGASVRLFADPVSIDGALR